MSYSKRNIHNLIDVPSLNEIDVSKDETKQNFGPCLQETCSCNV